MATDLELARAITLQNINDIAKKINLSDKDIIPYGWHKAKLSQQCLDSLKNNKNGQLILVTAMSPTPAGEGKTTVSVGLADGLNFSGKKTMLCLREPSLGPCFGMKGGAAGGGKAQVLPMEDINLHFTGDLHAITAAHNLLAALVDNHIYWGNDLGFDTSKPIWQRVLDVNDRALRNIDLGKGLNKAGFTHASGFDITAASEVMAIICLAENLTDLQNRLGRIVVGYTADDKIITASQLSAQNAMAVLLKDAILPNLVQTMEHNPAIIHGGPFANIAHGCNSVIATKASLKLADYVVVEAGFGSDLGAEKFFDIKCRQAGIQPDAVVLVATIRSLKMHGGVDKADLQSENIAAIKIGAANLIRHIENLQAFGKPVVVAINHFYADTAAEIACLQEILQALNIKATVCKVWEQGGQGALDLVAALDECINQDSDINYTYGNDLSLHDKIAAIATKIYKASNITLTPEIAAKLQSWEQAGYGHLPVCIAKTQYSFSSDPKALGAPTDFELPIREVRLAAGAGFIVAICGNIMTMPGLPRVPSANGIYLNEQGLIEGLF